MIPLTDLDPATKYYPPKSNGDLRNLHKAIVETGGADHHKISVLYYILLELDFATGRRDYSTSFAESSFLHQKYQIYMKGLWHLDRQEFEVSQSLSNYGSSLKPYSWLFNI